MNDRIQKLIALATDPAAADNEARNAALFACKLIREANGDFGRNNLVEENASLRKEIARLREENKRMKVLVARAIARGTSGESDSSSGERRRLINSRYGGRCSVCGEFYEEGETVAWAKGRGAIHEDCWDSD